MTTNSLTLDEETPIRADSRISAVDFETDTVEIPVRLCSLPPLNAIANQVLALSADPNVDLKSLGAVMECDPAFAADVLFLANSSLFGFPSRIESLRHAVAVLGLERIRALAVTVAMRGFVGKGGPLIRKCWHHSAACAIIAKEGSFPLVWIGEVIVLGSLNKQVSIFRQIIVPNSLDIFAETIDADL